MELTTKQAEEIKENVKILKKWKGENPSLKKKVTIWYVLQASDLVGQTEVELFPDEPQARERFNKLVEKSKQDVIEAGHEKELTNDEYCTIEPNHAYFSYEINGCNGCDYAVTLSSQEVEL